MKRIMLFLSLIFFVSALTPPQGDVLIKATYDPSQEDYVSYVASSYYDNQLLLLKATNPGDETALTIVRELLSLSMNSYYYSLTAADELGNQALYDVQVRPSPVITPITITMTAPSYNGISSQPSFPLKIQTDTSAVCTYAFKAPEYGDIAYPMDSSDGLNHEITGFETNYRFNNGELVPIMISCEYAGQTTKKTYLIGYSDVIFDPIYYVEPQRITKQGDPVSIIIDSIMPLSCTLEDDDGVQVRTEVSGRHIEFRNVDSYQPKYFVKCSNGYGEELPQAEVVIPTDLSPKEILVYQNNKLLYSGADTDKTIISVSTNTEATCSLTDSPFEDPALGLLAGGRMHQRAFDIEEGIHFYTVSCESFDKSISGQGLVLAAVDKTPPSVEHYDTPIICGNDTVMFLRSEEYPAYVTISVDGRNMMRLLSQEDTILRMYTPTAQEGDIVRVKGIDFAGNTGAESTATLSTARTEDNCELLGKQQLITLLVPLEGIAQGESFDLMVQSEFNSICTWDAGSGAVPFSISDGIVHEEKDFSSVSGLVRNQETIVSVACTDDASQTTTKDFIIAWDLNEPTITLNADPNPVVDPLAQSSMLTVSSDQEVLCRYDGGAYTNIWSKQITFLIAMVRGAGDRDVTVDCYNHANLLATETITIQEDYPSELSINVLSEPVTNNPSYTLNISTNMLSDCTADVSSSTLIMTGDGAIHTASYVLSQGDNLFTISCTDRILSKTATIDYNVVLDNKGPVLTLNASSFTCGLKSYTVKGTATDDSGIDNFYIEFAGNNWTVSSLPYILKDLNLTTGDTYSLEVWVTDLAGNSAGPAVQTVIAQSEETGACDTQKPVVTLQEIPGNNKTTISLLCEDDVGCDDNYKLSIGAVDGACNYLPYKFSLNESFEITEKKKVCWEVSDLSGNIASGDKVVDINVVTAEHCYNDLIDGDEEGLNCGGSCAPCFDTCKEDYECASGSCTGGLCAPDTCSNGVKDGGETDIDCGGLLCSPCGDNAACESSFDCKSNNCLLNICQSATCDDQRVNGGEPSKDCGGPCDTKCDLGDRCFIPGDCLTGYCEGGLCTASGLENIDPSSSVCGDGVCDRYEVCSLDCEGIEDPGVVKKTNVLGWVFIIIGLLSLLGGAGYIFYEKKQESQLVSSLPQQDNVMAHYDDSGISNVPKAADETDDFAKSIIKTDDERSEIRAKKEAERKEKRKDILREFDE